MEFAILKRLVLGVFLTVLALDGWAQTQSVFTVLASFSGTNGLSPQTGLIQGSDGNFYGTTQEGGTNQGGTVFMVTPNGTISTLNNFAFDSTNGCSPNGLVQRLDGSLYGTTFEGGDVSIANTNGYGTIFKITTNGVFTMLYAFTNGTDGSMPTAGLTLGHDGNLYGTTSGQTLVGNEDYIFGGGVFEMTTNDQFIALGQFPQGPVPPGYTAIDPYTQMTQGTDGNFYGTAMTYDTDPAIDKETYNGAIFRLSIGATNNVLTNLYMFTTGNTNGVKPLCVLVQGADGSFYGTTVKGGGANTGATAFKITTNGVLTTFFHLPGFRNLAGLVLGNDGNFYGVATGLGTNVLDFYELAPSGTMTVLISETIPDGGVALSSGPMIQASDGNFYGTVSDGGANGEGMVFRLSVPLQPIVRPLAQSNGALTLTWNCVASNTYQLQYSADLANWDDLGDPIVATNGTLSVTDLIGTNTQRFYQVILTQ